MIFHGSWVDQNIVNKYYHEFVQVGFAYSMYDIHDNNWGIG